MPRDASPLALLPQCSGVRRQEDVSCCAGNHVVAGQTAVETKAFLLHLGHLLLICCTLLQDTIREARNQQIQATDLLARLLQAPDAKAIAAEHVDSLTEEFFIMSSTYLDMVRAQQACLQDVLNHAVDLLKAGNTLRISPVACTTGSERRQPRCQRQAGAGDVATPSMRHAAVARTRPPLLLFLQTGLPAVINVIQSGWLQVIQIAMGEKQKTLRPEIQLLNTILACSSQSERQKVSLVAMKYARTSAAQYARPVFLQNIEGPPPHVS